MEYDFIVGDAGDAKEVKEFGIFPEGICEFTIRDAGEEDDKYWGDALKFKLVPTDGGRQWVWACLSKMEPHKIPVGSLATVLGKVLANGRPRLTPDDVEGVTVRAEIYHHTSKAGNISAQVRKFLPLAEAVELAEQKTPAARSQTAKARAAMTNDDDIPF